MLSLKYKILLFSIGFTAILSQLLIIREFLNVFEGNELIVGLFFCIWMMLTALGSFSAAKSRNLSDASSAGFLLLILSMLPSAQIAVLYSSQHLFFPQGSDISLPFIVLAGIIILFPLCFLSGRLFIQAASGLSITTGENNISQAYALESAGSILAGLLFITPVPFIMSTFQITGIIVLLNIIVFLIVQRKGFRPARYLVIIALYTLIALGAEKPLRKMHFNHQELLNWTNTPFGNISITKTGEQFNIYLNSNPLRINDPYFYEEPVHFILSQVIDPHNILILSGGLTQAKESLKYPSVLNADYIEINPDIVSINRRYFNPVNDQRVNIIIDDPRNYITHVQKKYDAIIINAPDPSTAQINRYFTREFFSQIRNVLSPSGAMGVSLSSSGNYMNDEALQLNGIIKSTLDQVFKNVTVIQGERNYFIASDAPVSPRVISRLDSFGIETTYVNSYYFQDDLLELRSNEILNQIDKMAFRVNTDLAPFAYFVQIGYALKRTGSAQFVFITAFVFAATLFVLLLLHTKRVYLQLFSASMAASAGQFMLIFVYQVFFGNIYRMLGVLTAFYMTGIVIGSMIKTEKLTVTNILNLSAHIALALLLALFGLFAAFIIPNTGFSKFIIQLLILSFSTLISFSFALIFNTSTRLISKPVSNVSGSLYGIDLAGSAAGIIIFSLVCIPLLGLFRSCIIAAVIVAIFGAFFHRRSSN